LRDAVTNAHQRGVGTAAPGMRIARGSQRCILGAIAACCVGKGKK
jgi:hypothetical protein